MSSLPRIVAIFAIAGISVACNSKESAPPVAPTGATEQPAPAPTAQKDKPGDDPTRSQISISDEIKKACGLTDDEAYFAFDSANLQGRDRAIFEKIATCFVKGPLSGKQMKLVGHADPRGEEEYNLALGGRRADNVRAVVVSDGMPSKRVLSTSRGELDATGTDETSWAKDRRVDVLVGS